MRSRDPAALSRLWALRDLDVLDEPLEAHIGVRPFGYQGRLWGQGARPAAHRPRTVREAPADDGAVLDEERDPAPPVPAPVHRMRRQTLRSATNMQVVSPVSPYGQPQFLFFGPPRKLHPRRSFLTRDMAPVPSMGSAEASLARTEAMFCERNDGAVPTVGRAPSSTRGLQRHAPLPSDQPPGQEEGGTR